MGFAHADILAKTSRMITVEISRPRPDTKSEIMVRGFSSRQLKIYSHVLFDTVDQLTDGRTYTKLGTKPSNL
uniref:Uncharacterized protein n=1 Tax=Moorena producens (strain JHB) TaxID=1454205 RepID=A0A1D9G7T0_MOOP1